MTDEALQIEAISGLPTVEPGDDLAALVIQACAAQGGLRSGDVLVVVSSGCAGRGALCEPRDSATRPDLGQAQPRGQEDPRLVHLILQESRGLSRTAPGVMIVRHKLGFISASTGIDSSNVGRSEEWVCYSR